MVFINPPPPPPLLPLHQMVYALFAWTYPATTRAVAFALMAGTVATFFLPFQYFMAAVVVAMFLGMTPFGNRGILIAMATANSLSLAAASAPLKQVLFKAYIVMILACLHGLSLAPTYPIGPCACCLALLWQRQNSLSLAAASTPLQRVGARYSVPSLVWEERTSFFACLHGLSSGPECFRGLGALGS